MLEDLQTPRQKQGFSEAWRLGRFIAGTALGPKQRPYLYGGHHYPTTEDIRVHLALHPAEKGPSATISEAEPYKDPPDLRHRWRDDREGQIDAERAFAPIYNAMKNRRSCPPRAPIKEIFQQMVRGLMGPHCQMSFQHVLQRRSTCKDYQHWKALPVEQQRTRSMGNLE